jgi:hypothetical protein
MSNAVSSKIKAYEDALKALLDTARNMSPEDTADELSKQFGALKAQGTELVATGHLKAMEVVGETRDTFCAIIELDVPRSIKNEIVLALMAHYTIDENLYRRVEGKEISPKTMLALHLQLSQMDPTSDEVTSRLTGLHISCFVEGFIETFVLRTGLDMAPVEFLKTIDCLKQYIQYSTTLCSDIEAIAAHLEQLRPGLEQVMRLFNHDPGPDGYKGRVADAVAMWAEFWVGLYETTQDPLIKELATVAFRRPAGPLAWQSYERIGLVRTPKWHMNAQTQAKGIALISLHEHAIITPDIDIISLERPDFELNPALFNQYVKMLARVPLTSPGARQKTQLLVDKLISYYQRNPIDKIKSLLVGSTIDPSFFSRHHQILGSRFAADLGL